MKMTFEQHLVNLQQIAHAVYTLYPDKKLQHMPIKEKGKNTET